MKPLKNNRGVAIIYVTLFLIVIGLSFLALGIDVGWLAYVRSRGQAMVDASALSGAAALPSYNPDGVTTQVFNMAKAFNSGNAVISGDTGISTDDSSTNVQFCSGPAESPSCVPPSSVPDTKKVGGVKVTRTFQTPLFFGKLLNGKSTTDITVSSTAWLGGAASACKPGQDPPCINVAPRACKLRNPATGALACGTVRTLFQSPDSGADNSAFTTFSSTGADDCKRMASNPATIPVANAHDTINLIGSGQVTSCLSDLKNTFDRLKGDDDCPGASPCWHVVLPVIACEDTSASSAELVGFASLAITDISTTGSPKTISGSLTCPASLPDSPGGGGDFGTYATHPVLVK
jgi:hypothetical protein